MEMLPVVSLLLTRVSGRRGCTVLGKATQLLHPVLLSSHCTSGGGSGKDFWQGKQINLVAGGCVERDPFILLERKGWEITACAYLQTEISAYTGLFHPASKNAASDAMVGCWSQTNSPLGLSIVLLPLKASLPVVGVEGFPGTWRL